MAEIGKENFVRPYIGRLDLSEIPVCTALDTPEMRKWYKLTDPTTHPEAPLLVWVDSDDITCCGMILVYLKYGNPPPDINCVDFYTSVEAISEVDTLPAEIAESALNTLRRYQVVTAIEEAFTFFLVIVAGLALLYLVRG